MAAGPGGCGAAAGGAGVIKKMLKEKNLICFESKGKKFNRQFRKEKSSTFF